MVPMFSMRPVFTMEFVLTIVPGTVFMIKSELRIIPRLRIEAELKMNPLLLMEPPSSTTIVIAGLIVRVTPLLTVQVSPSAMIIEVLMVVSVVNVMFAAYASWNEIIPREKITANTEMAKRLFKMRHLSI